ncbi:MAG: hypothetical protein KTR31_38440 [Myxococcales bacterium]|nr:hypothetical protein [Myxococcales bacterium]
MSRIVVFLALGACSGNGSDVTDTMSTVMDGLPVLGDGAHDLDSVTVTEVVSSDLHRPRDLEFHPQADELWVVNRREDSITIVFDPHGAADTEHRQAADGSGNHFLAKPSGLAFNNSGELATSHEEDQLTQGGATPEDFMGPTMWTADSDIFDGGHDSHLDMLHNSPNGAGIAWERQNVFWIYDGWHGALTRYDFADDHGLGGSDHTDGIIQRFADDKMGYEKGVVSHLAYDRDSDMLYAADSNRNAIRVLDTSSGKLGGTIGPNYDGCEMRSVDEAALSRLIDGADIEGMEMPSGLELVDGVLWVTDAVTSYIFAFDQDGTLLDYLDTGWPEGTLGGLAVDDEGDLWVVDQKEDLILEISPK